LSAQIRYLIDTDVCSYAIKKQPNALSLLRSLPIGSWGISSVTHYELSAGILQPNCSKAVRKAARDFLDVVTVLSFGEKAANAAAVAKQDLRATGLPTGQMDILIAGHALSLEASLVSNNLKHFENVKGLALKALA